jgi:tetratricopeptide (TPR) repeat protein
LLLKEGIIRERFGRYADALSWYTRGLDAADALEPDERARMRFELSLAYAGVKLRQGKFRHCIHWCTRVVDEADPARDLAALAHAFYLLHLSHTSLRSPERAAFRGLALPIYEELGDLLGQANVLNNLGIDAYYEGRWQEALDLYERSKEARERIGDVVGAAQITNNIGEVKSDQGYLTTAAELFEEARAVFEASGHRMLATLATSNLGRAASRAGELEDAQATLSRALDDFHEIRAGSYVLETKARLGELAVLAREPEQALALADDVLTTTEQTGSGATLRALLHRVRAYALAQQGDAEGATEALRWSIEIAREAEETYEAALTLEAIARLQGDDEAAAEARGLLARLGVVSTPEIPL